jgi:hypothetical protein
MINNGYFLRASAMASLAADINCWESIAVRSALSTPNHPAEWRTLAVALSSNLIEERC